MKHIRIIEENLQGLDTRYYVEKRFLWKWKEFDFKTRNTLSQKCNKFKKQDFYDLDKLMIALKEYKVIYYKHYKLEPYINDDEEVEFYCQKAYFGGKLKELQNYLDIYKKVIWEK